MTQDSDGLAAHRFGLAERCTSLGVSSLLPNVESIACSRSQTPAMPRGTCTEKHDEKRDEKRDGFRDV